MAMAPASSIRGGDAGAFAAADLPLAAALVKPFGGEASRRELPLRQAI